MGNSKAHHDKGAITTTRPEESGSRKYLARAAATERDSLIGAVTLEENGQGLGGGTANGHMTFISLAKPKGKRP